jgi:hypothetical protein
MRLAALLSLALLSCAPLPTSRVPSVSPSLVSRIGVIGDYGNRSAVELWASRDMALNGVEAIATVGDNVYPFPMGTSTYDTHVGEFFGRWIRSRDFFPAIGNHDWNGPEESKPFEAFFGVPRYYDVTLGSVHFFFLDSDEHEPDGIAWDSKQASWFRDRIAASPHDCLRFVVFHHPAVSTKVDQSSFCVGCEPVPEMDWPWASYGIDGVLSGHAHWAERFLHRGVMHWTVGATTDDLDSTDFPVDERNRFFASRPGYLMMETSPGRLDLGFRFARSPSLEDVVTMRKECI